MKNINDKIFFYTSLFGNYDLLNDPDEKIFNSYKFYCVTNSKAKLSKNWTYIYKKNNFSSNFLASRFYKILPIKIKKFMYYQYSIYFDANIEIKKPFIELVNIFIKSKCDLGLIKHPERNNIYEESRVNLKLGRVSKKTIENHNKYFKNNGYISKNDLTENCIIFRRHKKINCKKSMFLWWYLTKKFNVRDQHTLPFVRYKTKIKTYIFNINLRKKNKYVSIYPHSNSKILGTIKLLILKKSKTSKFFKYLIKFYLNVKNIKQNII